MALLRAIAFLLVLSFTFVFVFPVQALARRFDWPLQHRIQIAFCRAVCAVIGLSVVAYGRLPRESPRFLVANHVSWTDIIALASLYPLTFLAKSEVASWPVLGWLARIQGTIFVVRRVKRTIPAVNAALDAALSQGRDIVLFAEGTSSDGAQVLKFNAAHFAPLSARDAAARKPVVVPTAIVYAAPRARTPAEPPAFDPSWRGDMDFVSHLWRLLKRGGVSCHIYFGEAVEAADRKSLASETEQQVRRLLALARGAG